jgi:hypothetical protein
MDQNRSVTATFTASPTSGLGFKFDSDNQGWRNIGLYDDGGLAAIPGFFSDVPAPWKVAVQLSNGMLVGAGVIGLGSGGFTMPPSPSGNRFLHWDLNSPDLSNNDQWQGITAFTYDITGAFMASVAPISVEAVLHVRKPDSTESFFSDFIFHAIPLANAGGWTTHTVDVAALRMPTGTIILNINFRIFFEASTGHDGFIFIDNVVPID